MKKMLDLMVENGVEPDVGNYLFIFLKFISSIIPTIQYDFTTNVNFDDGVDTGKSDEEKD